jgi:BMFP domain-containing protein YqiC
VERESANGVLVHFSVMAAAGGSIFGQLTWIGVVTYVIFIVMGLVFVAAGSFLLWYWTQFQRRVNEFNRLLERDVSDDIAEPDVAESKSAENSKDSVIEDLWNGFGKTLVASSDGKPISATIEAEHVFTFEALCPEYSHNRVLAAVPGILATIGVLGTFASLSIGLNGIEIGADAGTDLLTSGVQGLIGAAGFAFLKSVFGVLAGLIITGLNKSFEWRVAHIIGTLQHQIENRYAKITLESSLVNVANNTFAAAENTRTASAALQELHERIGNQLQETVKDMSAGIETALRQAIELALQPAMEKLVATTTEQSSAVFDNLVEKFASSFTDIGTKQGAMLDESSTKLNDAIANVGNEFNELIRQSQAHSLEVAQRQTEILDSLTTTRDALTVSSADLASAATSLSEVSVKIESAGEALGSGLAQTAATLMSLYEKAKQEAAVMAELREVAATTDSDLTGAANRLAEATSGFDETLSTFSATQQEFLTALRSASEDTAGALRGHVEDLEKRVGEWLVNYSSDIEKQTTDRMTDWNTQSQDYASQMLTTAKVLSELLDDIQNERTTEAPLAPEAAS